MSQYLVVRVVEARSLSPADVNGWADPLAEVYIGDKRIGKTRHINKTLNPVWNETFSKSIEDKIDTIRVEIYDHDTLLSNDFLGQYTDELQRFGDDWSDIWYRLKDQKNEKNVKGYVRLWVQICDDPGMAFTEEKRNRALEAEVENKRKAAKENAIKRRADLIKQHQDMVQSAEHHNKEFKQQQHFNLQQRKVDQGYVQGVSQAPVASNLVTNAGSVQDMAKTGDGRAPDAYVPGMQSPPAPPQQQPGGMMYQGQPGMMTPQQPAGMMYQGQPGMMSAPQQPGGMMYQGQPGMMTPQQPAGMMYQGQPGMMSVPQQPGGMGYQ
jgi:hypothetical protein